MHAHYTAAFIQDFEFGGGGEQDGSRMIVICETHACLLGGSGGMPPRKILNLYIYLSELLLMQSGMKFLNI